MIKKPKNPFNKLFIFLSISPIVILLSFVILNKSIKVEEYYFQKKILKEANSLSIFTSRPEIKSQINFSLVTEDARPKILKSYLNRFKSPLTDYAEKIVQLSDKYDMDFRLIVAIARQESGLCKFIPENTYNCWGWGIHERGTLGFDSYEHGIETVIKGLKKHYIDKGLVTPEKIMAKYTPKSNGSWAIAVNQFLKDLE